MIHDRLITISAAGSRRATNWPAQTLMWSEMITKLQTPAHGTETLAEYLAMPKSQQDDLKDVGGYVAGALSGPRRKAGNVLGRDVLTLDLDNIPAGETDAVLRALAGLGCGYAVYSTRKHHPGKPRLRVLLPVDRTVSADEYEPAARKLASLIGMHLCDPTTFEASRLMYWPSCSSDGVYVFLFEDKPFLSADGVLAIYADWRNVQEWPDVPGTQLSHVRLSAKQGDPTAKIGIVGAFCKVYDIHTAIDTFLPGVYTPTEDGNRLTFIGGSTVGGAVVYDEGKFLFSHHATDPTSGRLVNSFDLVRLHRFGDLDDEATPGAPTNRLPSYTAMSQLAVSDETVASILNTERIDAARETFTGVGEASTAETLNWVRLLQLNPNTGTPAKTARNVQIVLEKDPALSGRIRKDLFSMRVFGTCPLPWDPRRGEGMFEWTDDDDAGLRIYIEGVLRFRSKDIVMDAFAQCTAKHSYHPVRDYLKSLQWDGAPRLDTMLTDYLGADDHPYTRAVSRKALVAAVARVMTPGVKFDTMTVIRGKQGLGKSTMIAKLARGWFSDAVVSMEGKEGAELLQGVWLVEIGELSAFNRSEISDIRMFLSRTEDHFRAAYARTPERHPRQCVFFGTTNDMEYLRDPAGNRRYWPINANMQQPTKRIFGDLDDEVDQLWAEAMMRWRLGESLILSVELEAEAESRRVMHTEEDPLVGIIADFLERPVPEDWLKWDATRRMMYTASPASFAGESWPRDRVCAQEIWRECLGEPRTAVSKADAARINRALERIPGWERASVPGRFGPYGTQRGFIRTTEIAQENRSTRSTKTPESVYILENARRPESLQ